MCTQRNNEKGFEMDDVICSVCGENLRNEKGEVLIAISFDLQQDNHQEAERVKQTFGKSRFDICWCCMLMAAGVKPLSVHNSPQTAQG